MSSTDQEMRSATELSQYRLTSKLSSKALTFVQDQSDRLERLYDKQEKALERTPA